VTSIPASVYGDIARKVAPLKHQLSVFAKFNPLIRGINMCLVAPSPHWIGLWRELNPANVPVVVQLGNQPIPTLVGD